MYEPDVFRGLAIMITCVLLGIVIAKLILQ